MDYNQIVCPYKLVWLARLTALLCPKPIASNVCNLSHTNQHTEFYSLSPYKMFVWPLQGSITLARRYIALM